MLTLCHSLCRDPVANCRDPLAKAILRAYLAKKQILSGSTLPSSLEDCTQLCKKSGLHLQESINLTSSLYQSSANRLHQLAQLLCCDWLLGTRKDIWELSQKSHFGAAVPTDPVELSSFQNDLESLQKLTHNLPAALPRVNFHCLNSSVEFWAVFSCGAVYDVVHYVSNFGCGWNPSVWTFKWKLSNTTKCLLFLTMQMKPQCVTICIKAIEQHFNAVLLFLQNFTLNLILKFRTVESEGLITV